MLGEQQLAWGVLKSQLTHLGGAPQQPGEMGHECQASAFLLLPAKILDPGKAIASSEDNCSRKFLTR